MSIPLLPPFLVTGIKGLSILLITAALGLELGKGILLVFQAPPLVLPVWLVGFERFALIAHGVEGCLSGYIAGRQRLGKPPLQAALYTFFVGTVGLLEQMQIGEKDVLPPPAI